MSTDDQKLDAQFDALKAAGVKRTHAHTGPVVSTEGNCTQLATACQNLHFLQNDNNSQCEISNNT